MASFVRFLIGHVCGASVLILSFPLLVFTQDKPASFVSAPKFILSPQAAAAGIDGIVKVSIAVDKTGSVTKVGILNGPAWPCKSSPDEEIEAVREAVKKNIMAAKFTPAMKNGEPRNTELYADFPIGYAYQSAVSAEKARLAAERGEAPPIIKAGVLNGRAVSLPKPVYPDAARKTRVSGSVSVLVIIDEQGDVSTAQALDGHSVFRGVSRYAACRARFTPYLLSGKPAKVRGTVTYNFVP